MYEIAAVVDDDVRAGGDHGTQMGHVFIHRAAVDRVDVHAARDERRRDVVLRGERVRARDMHLRAAHLEHAAEICCFGLQMHRQRDLQAVEGALLGKLFADIAQDGHVRLHPADLALAGRGKGDIFDRAHIVSSV